MDIIVTLPQDTRWVDYEKELAAVADGSQTLNFKVPVLPNQCKVGDRCFIAHQGVVRGFHIVTGLGVVNFTCTTTGRHWSGNAIQRSGPFTRFRPPFIPCDGFRGFRYVSRLPIADAIARLIE